jgi:hypothetical protein
MEKDKGSVGIEGLPLYDFYASDRSNARHLDLPMWGDPMHQGKLSISAWCPR